MRFTCCLTLYAAGGCDARPPGSGLGPSNPGGALFAREIWRVPEVSAGVGPAVDDSTVYFSNSQHQVFALRVTDGSTRWISASIGPNFEIGRALHVARNLVLYPQYDIHAFDVSTGQLAWRFSDSAHTAGGFFRLAADSAKVYGGSTSGVVVAVRLQDGSLAWRTHVSADTGQVNVYGPAVSNGRVFAGYARFSNPIVGGVVALDATTGAVIWQRDLPPVSPDLWGGAFDALTVWQDLVIVSGWDGRVRAFRSDSGLDAWTAPRPSGLRAGVNDSRPLAVVGDVIVVGSTLTFFEGLDARTGLRVWTKTVLNRGSLDYPIVSMGDSFLLRYTSLQVGRLDGLSGATLWETRSVTEPYVLADPAFDVARVYLATGSGFFALQR